MFAGRGRFTRPWFRRRTRGDDTGSMPIALLVTLVGVSLSAGLSGVVVSQLKESQRVADRVSAVNAAQAGLDAGLAQIRGAITGVTGDLTKLPCTAIPGSVDSGAYRVSVGYFLVDPSNLTSVLAPIGDLTNLTPLTTNTSIDTLLSSLGTTVKDAAHKGALQSAVESAVGCVGGVVKQVPSFGLLRSTGTYGTTSRTLYATYKFKTTEEAIPGGHIVIAGTSNQLCLGGVPADPADPVRLPVIGDEVKAVPCSSNDYLALFIYPRNISLSLAMSRTSKAAGIPYGLCITAAIQVVNAPVTFQPCAATKIPAQQWQYEVNQQTYFGTLDGVNRSGFCLGMKNPGVVNTPIVMKNGGTCGSSGAANKAFVPDADVGSGAAGINTGQLVNFQEVGRCLDLTNEDPKGPWFTSRGLAPALITYPCKQSFTGSVFWNHKWTSTPIPSGDYQVTGQVSTIPTSGSYIGMVYCLNSPGATGGYVWVDLCSVGGVNQQWTIYGASPLANEAYQVTDTYGHCLQAAGSLGSAYLYNSLWSEVIVTDCDGSGIQKWNAPRGLKLGPLSGIQER